MAKRREGSHRAASHRRPEDTQRPKAHEVCDSSGACKSRRQTRGNHLCATRAPICAARAWFLGLVLVSNYTERGTKVHIQNAKAFEAWKEGKHHETSRKASTNRSTRSRSSTRHSRQSSKTKEACSMATKGKGCTKGSQWRSRATKRARGGGEHRGQRCKDRRDLSGRHLASQGPAGDRQRENKEGQNPEKRTPEEPAHRKGKRRAQVERAQRHDQMPEIQPCNQHTNEIQAATGSVRGEVWQ